MSNASQMICGSFSASPIEDRRGAFGYDAVAISSRRAAPKTILRAEDGELPPVSRRRMVATSRDLRRNFVLVQWALQQYLDYVTTFRLRANCPDPKLNKALSLFFREAGRRGNHESTRRHSWRRSRRLVEAARILDGDILAERLNDGRSNYIEGDRIRSIMTTIAAPYSGLTVNGQSISEFRQLQGVLLDDYGADVGYVVTKRAGVGDLASSVGQFVFDKILPRQNGFLHGYYERLDQVRGVSRLAPAINAIRDVYEALDYALAKMKLAQMLGLAIYRNSSESLIDEDVDAVKLSQAPFTIDLGLDEKAELIESHTPATETQNFVQLMIQLSIKCFGIPYSFFDESHTNYSGQRQAYYQFGMTADNVREENRELLDWEARHKLEVALAAGYFDHISHSLTIDDFAWVWVATGQPYLNPLQEKQAALLSIQSGLSSPIDEADDAGVDIYDVVDERAAVEAYAKLRGVSFAWMNPADSVKSSPVQLVEVVNNGG
jgi:capsid protein